MPSRATVWRILRRHELITPQPHKPPRSSFIRFEAALPNELWQADRTHWREADGSDVEILNLNGAVFTGGPRRGRIRLETELERLGVVAKHSTPNNPQTCGKVECFHQTLKRYLAKQPPAASLADLQVPARCHPGFGFGARLKARRAADRSRAHFRVRTDRVSKAGNVTIRYLSHLRHIGLGRAHVGRPVKLLVADDYVWVVAEDGSLLRELVIDAGRGYQPRLHLSTMS